ncbi:AAA family ATPase [Bifidobacterium lemurum]|uniref:AAA family ATPase n=1 Tax=Bifidobacterium lemurum TaxID=1603886 RepID=A0A261FRT5_9BIFI|nr:DUF4143 domain-containing protein [Bifidobacterium lemurum]OZG61902.1 AAA family ATPase [Bifidobacterium lemurum]QOL33303.1 ATP-binding protein [Bifidobacterium lemurum]
MTKRYMKRIYDQVLKDRLEAKGAVLVEGPKWCGKTSTAEQIASSAIYLQNPSSRVQNLRMAEMDPARLLRGDVPRLIDEWQDAPNLWDAVRFEVDHRDDFGQFILTGSSVPTDLNALHHTGTGRIARMKMRTMSLLESGDSTGEASLSALFQGGQTTAQGRQTDIRDLAFLLCRGGWPRAVGTSEKVALRQVVDYLDAVCEIDISRVDEVRRNPAHARMLLRSYARMISSQGTLSAMQMDLRSTGIEMSESTFLEYVEALRKLFVIDDLSAWNPNLRSKVAIRTSPTRHLCDPSIAAAALETGPDELVDDLETFGLLFESMCVRDLRVYADALDGTVFHYRDKLGLECDAVVHLRDGRYGLIEIKLGGESLIAQGASTLQALARKIDTTKMRAPSFLMVLTGTGDFAYAREDGVWVVPICALGA